MGGPAGGDGGKGGSIIFEGQEGLSTLIDLRYNKEINAEPGENGMCLYLFYNTPKSNFVSFF